MYISLFDNVQEPSLTMNHILELIVRELLELYSTGMKIGDDTYYVELFNIACDDPGKQLVGS